MLNTRRVVPALGCCVLALAGASIAGANAAPKKTFKIKTTQRIVILFSTAHGITEVGTSDGRVGGVAVHGAVRAVAVSAGGSAFTATGALLYPSGTLRYVLQGTESAASGGLSLNASGKFTGGTGSYAGARGSFTVTGSKPPNSYQTTTITGKVSHR